MNLRIKAVADTGKTVILDNGTKYHVPAMLDRNQAMLWIVHDAVSIDGSKMTNQRTGKCIAVAPFNPAAP